MLEQYIGTLAVLNGRKTHSDPDTCWKMKQNINCYSTVTACVFQYAGIAEEKKQAETSLRKPVQQMVKLH